MLIADFRFAVAWRYECFWPVADTDEWPLSGSEYGDMEGCCVPQAALFKDELWLTGCRLGRPVLTLLFVGRSVLSK